MRYLNFCSFTTRGVSAIQLPDWKEDLGMVRAKSAREIHGWKGGAWGTARVWLEGCPLDPSLTGHNVASQDVQEGKVLEVDTALQTQKEIETRIF